MMASALGDAIWLGLNSAPAATKRRPEMKGILPLRFGRW